jgi:CHASE3 domain sensor protein
MRLSIGAKIFSIAIGLLILMSGAPLLSLRLSRQVTDNLRQTVDDYAPAYSALARANVRWG